METENIKSAIEAGIFEEVMVSTDDNQIKEIALQLGAKVPFLRTQKNSNDHATTSDVIIEVLDAYMKVGREFDYFTCIYPTAPFITSEKLKKSFDMLLENEADVVVPVVPFSFPPQSEPGPSDLQQLGWYPYQWQNRRYFQESPASAC